MNKSTAHLRLGSIISSVPVLAAVWITPAWAMEADTTVQLNAQRAAPAVPVRAALLEANSAPDTQSSAPVTPANLSAANPITAAASLTSTPSAACEPGLLFDDDFESPQTSTANGWDFGPSGSGANLWAPYVQSISETKPGKYYPAFANGTYQDFGALVEAQPTGPGYAEYGLLFRWTQDADGSNAVGYQFNVTTAGGYELAKQVGGQWVDPSPVPLTPSTYINTGNQRNVLGVIARGSTIMLYINGVLVNTVTDSTASQGTVGIYAATQTGSPAPPALVSYYRMSIFTADRAAADWGGGATNAAALAAASPIPAGATPSTSGVLFQDDFSSQQASLASGWHFISGKGVASTWIPGAMVMIQTNPTSYDYDFPSASYDNFGAEVKASPDGTTYAEYGVLFRATSTSIGLSAYVFEVSSDGRFWLSKVTNNSLQGGQLLAPAASSAIKQGAAQNVLRVLANGSQIRLFINGTFVGEVTDASFSSGGIGFYIAAENAPPAIVNFHSLRILTASEAIADWNSQAEPATTPAAP